MENGTFDDDETAEWMQIYLSPFISFPENVQTGSDQNSPNVSIRAPTENTNIESQKLPKSISKKKNLPKSSKPSQSVPNLPPAARQDKHNDSPVQQIEQSRLDRNKSPVVIDYSIDECIYEYMKLKPNKADLLIVGKIFKIEENRQIFLSLHDPDKLQWLSTTIDEMRKKDRSMKNQ